MTRPIYETGGQREAEARVARLVAGRMGYEAHPLPLRYPLDYAFTRDSGAVERWAEIKCRTVLSTAYPTYLLGLAKFLGLLSFQRDTNIPALLIVQWTDRVGVLRLPCQYQVRIGGRTDRADPQDSEPCAMIATRQFQLLANPSRAGSDPAQVE